MRVLVERPLLPHEITRVRIMVSLKPISPFKAPARLSQENKSRDTVQKVPKEPLKKAE